ncbi:MAG TPA: hypothetical protein VGM20_10670 [Gemmatimonadales bacterium]|jgi:hypothetical protein
MDIYQLALIIGAVGLCVMAFSGLGRHGGGARGHGGGHASHGGHAGQGHVTAGHAYGSVIGGASRIGLWMLMSPRYLFAALLGFGLIGVALHSWVGGTLLLVAAIAGGIAIERLLVAPLWKLTMRFASNPATTIESATFAEATVVSNFDRNGQGIVAVEVDGQVRQILATLSEADRARGARVRAGELVRVEEVDPARHRCVVSSL